MNTNVEQANQTKRAVWTECKNEYPVIFEGTQDFTRIKVYGVSGVLWGIADLPYINEPELGLPEEQLNAYLQFALKLNPALHVVPTINVETRSDALGVSYALLPYEIHDTDGLIRAMLTVECIFAR